MTSKKNKLKDSIKALNLNEPYILPVTPLSFKEPNTIKETALKKSKAESSIVKAKKIAQANPVVETTTGPIIDEMINHQPVVKTTTVKNSKQNYSLKKDKPVATFMIPHYIFEQVMQLPLTKNELKVLNCLIRFSLGFHRSFCEAGLSFVCKWTGIKDKNNVSKALKRLIDKKHIKKIKDYDCKKQKGTTYEVVMIKNYYKNIKKKQPEVDTTPEVNQPTTRGENDHPSVVDSTTKKENSNKIKNKTLSPEIESHFNNLSKRKQSSETKALEELLESFTTQQISDSFNHIQKHGDLSYGKPVHSPFKYLAIAISDVLKKVTSQQQKLIKSKVNLDFEKQREDKENIIAELKKKKQELIFLKTFPEEKQQNKKIKEIINKMPFKVPVDFQKSIAIERWYDEQHKHIQNKEIAV